MDRNRRLDGWFKTFFPLWLSAKREFNTLMYFDRSLNVEVSSLWLLFFGFCFYSDMHNKKKKITFRLDCVRYQPCTVLYQHHVHSCVALKGPVHGILCRKTESV